MPKKDAKAESPERSFDKILEELEGVIRDLEGDVLPLEEALKRFEAGVGLAREGAARLDAAERRVEEILKDGTVAPLPPIDE
ncbi:MAG: exodeoxyribonuclease VII small subunit [Proteobacteria bacterium]|jgi:exodeoxyribonuclease VII small subunit|nr:exodeoxyribonuclease VII small subunit [Pseudomonadota bacterium]